MLRFLRNFFRSGHPLAEKNLSARARDISFRVMEDADIDVCLGFYRANESNLPANGMVHYETGLRKRSFLSLIAIRDGAAVGCCGIQNGFFAEGTPKSHFCYGLVDPRHQGQGVGTAQVLARLSLLTVAHDLAVATMLTVPKSVSFYRRFGFDFSREMFGDDRQVYPYGLLKVSQSFIDDCHRVLVERNIGCPDVRDKIPVRKLPEPTEKPNPLMSQ